MSDTKQADILVETALLKTMSNRHNYDVYMHYVDKKRVLETTRLLLEDYAKYFESKPSQEIIDFNEFFTLFCQKWHQKDLDQLDIDYYQEYVFPAITKAESQEVTACLMTLVDRQTSSEIIDAAKDLNVTKIRELLTSREETEQKLVKSNDKELFTIDKVDFTVLDKAEGIPFFLPSLQQGLGSLVKGQFVVVSADYGTGKSAFVLSQAAHTLEYLHKKQDKRPIIYFNSEGTEADVYGRMLSNLYHKQYVEGFEQVVEKINEIKKMYMQKYDTGQFMVFQIAGNNLASIKTKIDKYKPSLVIIDICDTLAPEEDVQHLKKLYDGLRLLSGAYCPIIGTTQAGNTSYEDKESGKTKTRKWLGDKALYGSKAGKGGAADTIITIGKDDDSPGIRYVATPKKKRGKEVNITCELIDEYSLYREIGW